MSTPMNHQPASETISSRLRARCGQARRIRERAAEVTDPGLEPLRVAMKRRASELELEAHLYATMLDSLTPETAASAA